MGGEPNGEGGVASREFHYEKLVVSLRLSMSFITTFWGIG